MVFKNWLQLCRAQTAPLTVLVVLVAYLDGDSDLLVTIALTAFAILVHYISYGHNSVLDYQMGYDSKDPQKQHHPLVNGDIGINTAIILVNLMVLLVSITSILLVLLVSISPIESLVFLLTWITCGFIYNGGLSKESKLASTVFACYLVSWFLFGWFLSHVELTNTGLLSCVYLFLLSYVLINWAGDLKDVEMFSNSNILVHGKLVYGLESVNYYLSYKTTLILLYITLKISFSIIVFFLSPSTPYALFISGIYFYVSAVLIDHTVFAENHANTVKYSYLDQVLNILYFVFAVLHPLIALLLAISAFLYYRLMNRYLWCASYPRV